eukprot:5470640-Pleurochrysis_carterae.AAC.1
MATYRALTRQGSRHFTRTQMPNVTHVQIDLDDASSWSGSMSKLHAEGQPLPDIMHASPPCAAHSKLASLPRRRVLEASLVEATMRRWLCKKAPQDWWVVDVGSSPAERFDQPGSSVTHVQGGKHDGQIDDEDDVDIVEQIDAARQGKGYWEHRVIWEGYLDPTWKTDVTLSTAGEQVQAMMRKARNLAEGEQKGTRKAARARKAGVNLFTALEPSLGSSPIFRMR